jgi:hypothetical protein
MLINVSGISHVEFRKFSNVSVNTAVAAFRFDVWEGGRGVYLVTAYSPKISHNGGGTENCVLSKSST